MQLGVGVGVDRGCWCWCGWVSNVGSSSADTAEGVALAFPQAMVRPDLPRWINRSNVDSPSMLSAFLWYRAQCRELECLYSIDHRGKDTLLINGMRIRPQRIEDGGPVNPLHRRTLRTMQDSQGRLSIPLVFIEMDAQVHGIGESSKNTNPKHPEHLDARG